MSYKSLRYLIMYNISMSNQKNEFSVYYWLWALAMFYITPFHAFVGTSNVILIVLLIRDLRCFQFFVAADPTVKNDRLWHDKYSLRKSMIPAFITTDQARRVGWLLSQTFTSMIDRQSCKLCLDDR